MTTKEMWATIINDARWYDGTPQMLTQLSEHFEKQGYIISKQDQGSEQNELWEALQDIEKCCDNQNPTHEQIWRIAHAAIVLHKP